MRDSGKKFGIFGIPWLFGNSGFRDLEIRDLKIRDLGIRDYKIRVIKIL